MRSLHENSDRFCSQWIGSFVAGPLSSHRLYGKVDGNIHFFRTHINLACQYIRRKVAYISNTPRRLEGIGGYNDIEDHAKLNVTRVRKVRETKLSKLSYVTNSLASTHCRPSCTICSTTVGTRDRTRAKDRLFFSFHKC